MKAVVLDNPGKFRWADTPHPGKPGRGEVLLKVRHLSICGTDLHAFKGRQPFFSYPRILGHEIAAEVIEVGEGVSGILPGDLCSVEPYRNPVMDQAVKRGKTNCGSQLTVLGVHEDGAMREYFVYQAANIHVTRGLHPDKVALIEPLAIACHAIERAALSDDDTVLVIGAGPIGIAIIALARLSGLKIISLDVNRNRLDFVKDKYPETETLLLTDKIVDDLQTLLNSDLPTVIFDATGNKTSMQNSFNYVAPGGTIVFVGLFVGDVVFDDPNFHRKEITLMASRSARSRDFKKVIELLTLNKIDTSGFITHRIPFQNIVEEFEKLYLPEENVIKAIIDF
ncbi:2-desacetyl-2-hydroxyethyl bacteriochlorophyllide A dehydrogenase [Anseongella ginsenosidimutans]|uniref:2-desacetyl-2-hydroxyethyl bacteriochlorophyllide A dehydrogenase n=1 Tax=Anseongella ginsenosidimutans TaxID=496056 RepID=A0A4R3KMC1_9SPHI|nr:zinc-binding alcohol dehydrogenase family protein [Anseongella ginsenosidimutans]QEC52693.1 zinc-binding alcohol dehydrogenase family protein [Anseongella ginsenosidimutans]TCS85441.1 2-desacetyl-2-hydroxyethyl bacteriochlorophyllide A dehydrogenase [Anseongella ginsenosidimutans]